MTRRQIRHDEQQPALCGFTPVGSTVDVAGIHLVHVASQDEAKTGDLVAFTAWILNATTEVLTNVTLRLRSFTNENADQLDYLSQPPANELAGRTLGPRQALTYRFSYKVTERDVQPPGLLISALEAVL